MATRSVFRGNDPARDEHRDRTEADTRRLDPLPQIRPATAPLTDADGSNLSGGSGRRKAIALAGVVLVCLVVAGLAAVLVLSVMHTSSVRDDYRGKMASMRAAQSERLTQLAAEDAWHEARAVSAAVAKQKRVDARKLRRTIRAERRRAARQVAAARSAGYSAGSADGYNEGTAQGYDRGLSDGSDDLTCSDDPDVTWLPYCNW